MKKFLLNARFIFSLALWMFVTSVPPSGAFAMPSDSLTVFTSPSIREAQIQQIMTVLSRPEVKANLMMSGITEEELRARLLRLDGQQLTTVAEKAQSIKAGRGAVGWIVLLLVISLLVILIGRLSDKTIEVRDK